MVSVPIVIAAARGIIAHERKDMLSEFGGCFIPAKNWARCMLYRMGLHNGRKTRLPKRNLVALLR